MQHTVYTDEELLRAMNNLIDGEAFYEVLEGKTGTSKSGNPMVSLKLKISDKEGNQGIVRDWILLTPRWAFKFKAFWDSCNNIEIYKRGHTDDIDYIGKTGKCEIKWQESTNEAYQSAMKVTRYLPYDGKNIVIQPEQLTATIDDIPF